MRATTAVTAPKTATSQPNSSRASRPRTPGRGHRRLSGFRRRRRQFRLRAVVLPMLLTTALLLGLCQTALAEPAMTGGPPTDVKAITAMDSKPSSLRMELG
jgi:hypothetical protein